MLRRYSLLIPALVAALLIYMVNKLVFLLPGPARNYEQYYHSLESLYLFFTCCMIAVLIALIIVNKRSFDHTGYAYLAATVVQMALSYVMLRPVLNSAPENSSFEKLNFFVVFILFLAIETAITIRLLNNKQ